MVESSPHRGRACISTRSHASCGNGRLPASKSVCQRDHLGQANHRRSIVRSLTHTLFSGALSPRLLAALRRAPIHFCGTDPTRSASDESYYALLKEGRGREYDRSCRRRDSCADDVAALSSRTLVLRECNKQRSEKLHGWLTRVRPCSLRLTKWCSGAAAGQPHRQHLQRPDIGGQKSQPVRRRVCQGASLHDGYRGDRHRQHRQGSDVCNAVEVNCINLMQLIVAEDWVLCDPMFTDRSTSNKHQTDCTHRYSLGPPSHAS